MDVFLIYLVYRKFNYLHEFNKIITVKGHVLYIIIVMKPHSLLQTLKSSISEASEIHTNRETNHVWFSVWMAKGLKVQENVEAASASSKPSQKQETRHFFTLTARHSPVTPHW